jgi:hypothetical protein
MRHSMKSQLKAPVKMTTSQPNTHTIKRNDVVIYIGSNTKTRKLAASYPEYGDLALVDCICDGLAHIIFDVRFNIDITICVYQHDLKLIGQL